MCTLCSLTCSGFAYGGNWSSSRGAFLHFSSLLCCLQSFILSGFSNEPLFSTGPLNLVQKNVLEAEAFFW